MDTIKRAALIIALIIFNLIAMAQGEEYATDKLEKFIDATTEIFIIQEESQDQMLKAIEKENLDVETFNEIAEMRESPGQIPQSNITEEQLLAFENVVPEIQIIQLQMQNRMENAIRECGLDVEEYLEVMNSYRNDPALQQRVNEMLNEN